MSYREKVLVVVHPGSALGSADSNLGGFAARAGRDALQWAFDHWEGSVVVIHGNLSDDLPYYPEFRASLIGMLARAKAAGNRSDEIQGDDRAIHNQEAAISQWVVEQKLTPGNTEFELTGAWYNGGTHFVGKDYGCVGSVLERLLKMGFLASVDERSVLDEPDQKYDESEDNEPVLVRRPTSRRRLHR